MSGAVEGNIVITGMTQKNCQNQRRHDPNALSRVVVPMALKQVSPKPGPCPASSGPRDCLAPAPGMTRRRRQGLATGTGHLVEVGFEHVVLRGLRRYLAGTPYPTPKSG